MDREDLLASCFNPDCPILNTEPLPEFEPPPTGGAVTSGFWRKGGLLAGYSLCRVAPPDPDAETDEYELTIDCYDARENPSFCMDFIFDPGSEVIVLP